MPARSWRLTKAGLVNRNAWRMVLAHLRRAKLLADEDPYDAGRLDALP